MKWRQVQQVPGDSNWRCHGMYGIWNKQCQLLQISTKVFCSAHCLQMVRRTLCQTKVSSNLWCIDVKCININGHTSLTFACQYFESFNITDSFIYKWDDTKFVYFVLVLFRLVEPLIGIRSWSAVVLNWVWSIPTTAATITTLSQLCTRPLEDSSSSTKRVPLIYRLIWCRMSTKVTLILQWKTTTITSTT